MTKLVQRDDKFYFVANDGQEKECKVWLEKKAAFENTHPEGKPWIVLPNGNEANRKYISLDKFNAENVDGELEIEVKVGGPRVIGSSGAKPAIIKYLSEEERAEFDAIVDPALEKYKAMKGQKKMKLEDITDIAVLEQMIMALENGEAMPTQVAGPKNFKDCMTDEEFERYNELLAIAQEKKANAPKAVRGPLTEEQKAARKAKAKEAKLNKLYAALEALKVAQGE